MQYSIGDVSKILNISKEMIRYYEKQGALKPTRIEDNNYRMYSTMDIFFLMEMIRYQSFGLTIKEVTELVRDHYMDHYADYLEGYYQQLQKEIVYKSLLKERVKEMSIRARTSQLNLEKYWFKEIPSMDLVFLCTELNDDYDKILLGEDVRASLFQEENFTFFESMVIFEEGKNTWWYGINQDYADALSLNYDYGRKLEQKLCLCTMIDMGEVGAFSRSMLDPVMEYAEKNGYVIDGMIRGMIVCRGYENGIFQRILELQVPIKH